MRLDPLAGSHRAEFARLNYDGDWKGFMMHFLSKAPWLLAVLIRHFAATIATLDVIVAPPAVYHYATSLWSCRVIRTTSGFLGLTNTQRHTHIMKSTN